MNKSIKPFDKPDDEFEDFGQDALPTVDYVVCPKCFELLTRSDLEGFGRCPYCDHTFEFNRELEDFLLQPVIRQWSEEVRSRIEEQ